MATMATGTKTSRSAMALDIAVRQSKAKGRSTVRQKTARNTTTVMAALDASQTRHAKATAALRTVSGPFLLSPFVLAEIDYLLATRVGVRAQRALLDEVARGAYRLEPFTTEDVAAAAFVLRRYPDLEIGLADESIVARFQRQTRVPIRRSGLATDVTIWKACCDDIGVGSSVPRLPVWARLIDAIRTAAARTPPCR